MAIFAAHQLFARRKSYLFARFFVGKKPNREADAEHEREIDHEGGAHLNRDQSPPPKVYTQMPQFQRSRVHSIKTRDRSQASRSHLEASLGRE